MSLSYQVPDGRSLTIVGVSASDFYGPWLWLLQHRSTSGLRRISIGAAQGQEAALRAITPADSITKRSASAHGGTLVALEADNGTTIAWIGAHNELSVFVPMASAPFDPFVELLDDLVLTDTSHGLKVLPREDSGVQLVVLTGTNAIHGSVGDAGVQIDPIERVSSLPAG